MVESPVTYFAAKMTHFKDDALLFFDYSADIEHCSSKGAVFSPDFVRSLEETLGYSKTVNIENYNLIKNSVQEATTMLKCVFAFLLTDLCKISNVSHRFQTNSWFCNPTFGINLTLCQKFKHCRRMLDAVCLMSTVAACLQSLRTNDSPNKGHSRTVYKGLRLYKH